MTVERRRFVRQAVSGEAEITSVTGSTDIPPGKGRVLDCSRGGALLRFPSPKRHLFKKLEPCLRPMDSVTCTLRMPPTFQDVEVFAEVVRVTWSGEGDDTVNVGVRFFYDAQRRSHTDKDMQCLYQALGPACWSSASIPALPAHEPKKTSARLPEKKTSARLPEKKTSARLPEKKTSARQPKKTSARLPKNGSARLAEKKVSARLPKNGSARLPKNGSARLAEKKTSARLPRSEGARPPARDSSRLRVSLKYHSSSGRIPAAAMAPPTAYHRLAGPEFGLYLRGRGTLSDGKTVIELPQHFSEAIQPETMTVHLTPTGMCLGLYLAKRSATHLVVAELCHGRSSASFDYMVVAQRRIGG